MLCAAIGDAVLDREGQELRKIDAKVINDAVEPVGGYVDNLSTATEVAAVFIHVAAGGLHH